MKRLANISLLILLWALTQPTLHAQYIEISGSDVDGKDTGLYTMDFGTVQYGQQSQLKQLRLTNTAQASLSVSIQVFRSYEDQGFYTNAAGFELAPGERKTLSLFFKPGHSLNYSTSLLITELNGRGTTVVTLTGKGRYDYDLYKQRSLSNPKGSGQYYNNAIENYNEVSFEDELGLYNHLKSLVSQRLIEKDWEKTRTKLFYYVDNLRLNQGQARTDQVDAVTCVYSGMKRTLPASYRYLVNRSFSKCESPTLRIGGAHKIEAEHTFPAKYFSKEGRERSNEFFDLHHLFPALQPTNGSRGDTPFGELKDGGSFGNSFYTDTPFTDAEGDPIISKRGIGILNDQEETVFEPSNQHKGTAARAMFYFMLAYGPTGRADLGSNSNVEIDTDWFKKQEPILRTWNRSFKPSGSDTRRNTLVQLFQENRNPFVDFPELVDRLPNITNPGQPLSSAEQALKAIDLGTIQVGTEQKFRLEYVNTGNTTLGYTYSYEAKPSYSLQVDLLQSEDRSNTAQVKPLNSNAYVSTLTATQTGQHSFNFTMNYTGHEATQNGNNILVQFKGFCPDTEGLRADNLSSAALNLDWTKVPDAFGYELMLENNTLGRTENIYQPTDNAIQLQNLTPGTDYTVKLFTRCNANVNSTTPGAISFTTPLQDPEPPQQGARVALFPNPGATYTTLIIDSVEPQQAMTVRLVNSQMIPVRLWNFNNSTAYQEFDLDLSNVAHGVYTLLIETPTTKQTKQLIIVSQ